MQSQCELRCSPACLQDCKLQHKAESSASSWPITTNGLSLSQPACAGVIADLGSTLNSTATVQHMMAGSPQVFTLIGEDPFAGWLLAAPSLVSGS